VRNAADQQVRIAGALTDITDKQLAAAELFAEKERAQVTLASIGDGVITTDIEGWVEYLNPVAEDLTGWKRPKSFRRLSSSLQPASGKSIWSCYLTVPRDAYVEYVFHDPVTQESFLDPWNSHTVSNGMGDRNNFFYMPETMPSPFSMRRADVRTGILTRHRVDTWLLQEDGERDVYLYKPHAKGPFPLLVVYDGPDYLQRGRLATMVDNLIADKRIRPIAMAFLQNGRSRRSVEYLSHLVESLYELNRNATATGNSKTIDRQLVISSCPAGIQFVCWVQETM